MKERRIFSDSNPTRLYFNLCYNILYLFSVLGIKVNASAFEANYDLTPPGSFPGHNLPIRSLRAARLESNIKARSIERYLDHEIDLHYLDEQTHQTDSQFAARVRMSTKLPTIVLEEVEHHISEITCFGSSIHLHFSMEGSVDRAFDEFSAVEDFFVVTSHEGCNKDGEREPHRVSGISLNEDHRVIILSTSVSQWREAVHFVDLRFGPSGEDYELRRHNDLRPRQATATSTAAPTIQPTTISSSLASNISLSYPSTTATPTTTDLSYTITQEPLIDTTILPPNIEAGFSGDLLPNFNLVCKNCTIGGSIEVLSGAFRANLSDDDELFEAYDFYKDGGYFELLVNNFSAYIELETTAHPSLTLFKHTSNFPVIAFPLLVIPNIAAVGPQLVSQVSMGVKLQANLTFTYGFEVTVPNDSSVIIQVGNLSNSSIMNFPSSKLKALPFQAEVNDIDLELNTGFQPKILIGATILNGKGTIGTGIGFDLPYIDAIISPPSGPVNATCDPVDASSPNVINGTVINIVPSVNFDAEFFVEAALYNLSEEWGMALDGYALSLPTKCLVFESAASGFVPASSIRASSAPTKKASAAAAIRNPFAIWVGNMGRFGVVALTLAINCALFGPL